MVAGDTPIQNCERGVPPGLPAGVLTFLLTDIEGSVARWELAPAAMRVALARHDAIMSDILTRFGGHIFRTAGDAFYAAFALPTPAVAAALAAQTAIAAEDFDAVGGLPVRMAVHAGPVEARGGEYFGQGIDRAARLLAVTHGGQVLISGTVAQMCEGELPPDSNLIDLGRHILRDRDDAEQIFQLSWPALSGATFPPLRTIGARLNNLPLQATSFIGRQRELAEIEARLNKARLVTVMGPGGVGKSRFSIQAGFKLLANYPDGVWFLDLESFQDPRLVAEAVCNVLGTTATLHHPPMQSALTALRNKRLLLILDGCEHLIAAVAELASAILRSCPLVSLLVASRERVNIPGETVLAIPSLDCPSPTTVDVEAAAQYRGGAAVPGTRRSDCAGFRAQSSERGTGHSDLPPSRRHPAGH